MYVPLIAKHLSSPAVQRYKAVWETFIRNEGCGEVFPITLASQKSVEILERLGKYEPREGDITYKAFPITVNKANGT